VRAVSLAHLAGRWVRDADAIVSWARQRGVFVIDDAAQAFGLTVGGRAAGTLGDVGVFSSGAGKPIFGPGGGWLVTRSAELASNLAGQPLPRETDAAAKQRLHSFVRRFTRLGARRGQRFLMEALTFRFRGQPAGDFSVMAMNDLDAAVARPQVSNIAAAIQQRGRCADRWRALLRSVPLGELRVPSGRDTIHTNLVVSSAPGLRRVLWAHGVETEAWYTPLHLRSPFDRLRRTALPNTERQWQGTFGVPVRPNLTERDWVRIERAVEHAAQLSNGRGR
jgi:aminotransferase